ncbi:hypothetical protein [Falsirhodobacter sp. 1013]|uniref:hypothetical protein n=1 Tax=Falsirhodobacter sp. 1013 TaxID=3417566 RepID=UPI003EBB3638
MQLYIATYWKGTAWTDLHTNPLTFREAQDKATSAMLNGCGTTRLRLADHDDTLADISAEQIAALHAYAARYGADWKHYLVIEWQCATAPALLHRLRNTHGPSWLEGFTLPQNALT